MAEHTTGPDEIFNDDDLYDEIARKMKAALAEIAEITGEDTRPAEIDHDYARRWPREAQEIFARYKELHKDYTRRTMIRENQRMSRFLSGINGDEDTSEEMMRWWMNRY